MITGIPNVGKSTLINLLVRKAAARTGNQAGITRGRQWIGCARNRTARYPGVLSPRLNAQTAFPLAAVGALPPGRLDVSETALWLLTTCRERGRKSGCWPVTTFSNGASRSLSSSRSGFPRAV